MAASYRKKELLFEICLELGECYAALGEVQAAELNFFEALDLRPGNPKPYIGLARLAASGEHWDQALTYLEKALEIQPNSDEALSLQGSILLETNRGTEAQAKFQEALKYYPENREALLGLAQAVEEPDQVSSALECLKQYLATHLVDFPVLLSLARLHIKQGNLTEAQEAVDKVLLFHPQDPEALSLKERLGANNPATAHFS